MFLFTECIDNIFVVLELELLQHAIILELITPFHTLLAIENSVYNDFDLLSLFDCRLSGVMKAHKLMNYANGG